MKHTHTFKKMFEGFDPDWNLKLFPPEVFIVMYKCECGEKLRVIDSLDNNFVFPDEYSKDTAPWKMVSAKQKIF